jgi:glycosyltransferase 2 family protein
MWNDATQPAPESAPPPPMRDAGGAGGHRALFADYFWFILKNIVGWAFVLASFVLGPVPGPGGIIVFLIGFGMISFPGKRRLMVRIFRGRQFELRGRWLHLIVTAAGMLLAVAAMGWLFWRDTGRWHAAPVTPLARVGIYAAFAMIAWLAVRFALRGANWLVGVMPKIRRKVRPMLRRRGVDLLPPRLRRRAPQPDGTFAWHAHDTGEVIRLHARHRTRLRNTWTIIKPWLRRLIGVGITVAIFAWMLKPVVQKWDQVGVKVMAIKWYWFALAALMFASFLFVFRVLSWWRILDGFGYRLPLAPATRIWSTSELARYLPGVIWQVVGRVYLVKPYGVSGTVCSASQLLELVVFLLANVLVAIGCLAWFAYRMPGDTKFYLYLAAGLVPLLMLLLHPRVFYTILTRYMTWRGKELPARRVRGKTLTLLAGYAILGLLWQSAALWLLTHEPLHLKAAKWWIVAGSYCLAWCAGFIAFWAPGGLGVREFVFVTAMMFALPRDVRKSFQNDHEALFAFLAFLGILLRLWATAGELILAGIAYALDYRGALGRPDAPGRVAAAAAEPVTTQA